jgi:hypothetical protein
MNSVNGNNSNSFAFQSTYDLYNSNTNYPTSSVVDNLSSNAMSIPHFTRSNSSGNSNLALSYSFKQHQPIDEFEEKLQEALNKLVVHQEIKQQNDPLSVSIDSINDSKLATALDSNTKAMNISHQTLLESTLLIDDIRDIHSNGSLNDSTASSYYNSQSSSFITSNPSFVSSPFFTSPYNIIKTQITPTANNNNNPIQAKSSVSHFNSDSYASQATSPRAKRSQSLASDIVPSQPKVATNTVLSFMRQTASARSSLSNAQ